jgi:hypothetical protein
MLRKLEEHELEVLAACVIILVAIAYFVTRLILLSNIARRDKGNKNQTH